MRTRMDLPPTARKLNDRLIVMHDEAPDGEYATALQELRWEIVDAVTSLENDLIIARGQSRPAA